MAIVPKIRRAQVPAEVAKPVLPEAAAYRAASSTHPDLHNWTPAMVGPIHALEQSRGGMAPRLDDLVRNNGWASGAVQRHLDSIVGAGFKLSARPNPRRLGITEDEADDLATEIEDCWAEVESDPLFSFDYGRTKTVGQLQALALRHKIAHGDAIAVVHWDESRRNKTCIEIIHPHRMKNPRGVPVADGWFGGVKIVNGQPVEYSFSIEHPGERTARYADRVNTKELPRYFNERPVVVHAFDQAEAGQHRGVPLLAPIVKSLHMLERYDETEVQSSILNSILGAFITTPMDPELMAQAMSPDSGLTEWQKTRAELYKRRPINLPQGVRLNVLAPGDEPKFLTPRHPNSIYEQFERVALRNIASAIGLSYEQISQDWSQVNYSSARAALLEIWRGLTVRRQHFASSFMQPIYMAWLQEAVDAGKIRVPKTIRPFDEAPGAWCAATWNGPGKGWVDPVKEVTAALDRVDGTLSSHTQEAAEQGLDYREVLAQRRRDRKAAARNDEPMLQEDKARRPVTIQEVQGQ